MNVFLHHISDGEGRLLGAVAQLLDPACRVLPVASPRRARRLLGDDAAAGQVPPCLVVCHDLAGTAAAVATHRVVRGAELEAWFEDGLDAVAAAPGGLEALRGAVSAHLAPPTLALLARCVAPPPVAAAALVDDPRPPPPVVVVESVAAAGARRLAATAPPAAPGAVRVPARPVPARASGARDPTSDAVVADTTDAWTQESSVPERRGARLVNITEAMGDANQRDAGGRLRG